METSDERATGQDSPLLLPVRSQRLPDSPAPPHDKVGTARRHRDESTATASSAGATRALLLCWSVWLAITSILLRGPELSEDENDFASRSLFSFLLLPGNLKFKESLPREEIHSS